MIFFLISGKIIYIKAENKKSGIFPRTIAEDINPESFFESIFLTIIASIFCKKMIAKNINNEGIENLIILIIPFLNSYLSKKIFINLFFKKYIAIKVLKKTAKIFILNIVSIPSAGKK